MGRLPTGNRKYQITHLWEDHKEIARRLLMGEKAVDIADDMGYSPVTVSITRNSQIFKDHMAVLEAQRDADSVDVARRIQELAPVALQKLRTIMDDEDTSKALQTKIAMSLLDRAGHGAITKVTGMVAHAKLTPDDLQAIKERARRTGAAMGMVIDTQADVVGE
jgi:hypothetical protein